MSWQQLLESDNPWLNVPTRAEGAGAWSNLVQQPQARPGLVTGLLREVGKDIKGAFRVGAATVFTLPDLLGIDVPISWDDIERRDITGAAMMMSMFVGAGLAGKGIQAARVSKGVPMLGKQVDRFAKDISALHKAGIWTASETAAGGFFGAFKSLEADQDRLREILKDAALFGALGGTMSLFGSAVKATAGARLAEMAGRTRQAALAHIAQTAQTRTFLQEFAGVRLRNPETQMLRDISRRADGTVSSRHWDLQGNVVEDIFPDFNEALAHAFEGGFKEKLGLPRSVGALRKVEGLDPQIVEQIRKAGGTTDGALSQQRIVDTIEALDLSNYEAARAAAKAANNEQQTLTWLGMEAVTEGVSATGEVVLDAATRRNILDLLPRDVAKRIGRIEKDADFLREAILEGALDIQNIADATTARSMMQELAVNARLPDIGSPYVYLPTPSHDISFLGKVMTPKTIAKAHPEIQPLYDLWDAAAREQIIGIGGVGGTRNAQEFLRSLENSIPTKKLARVAAILDDVQDVGSISEARRIATEAAASTRDPQMISAMEQVIGYLDSYRLRAVSKGRLGQVADADPAIVQQARQAVGEALEEAGGDALKAEQALRRRFGRVEGWEILDASPSETVQRLGGRVGAGDIVDLTKMRNMPDPPLQALPKEIQQAMQQRGGDLVDLMMSDHPLASKATDVAEAFYGKMYRVLEQLYEKGNIADFFLDNPEYRYLVPDYIPNLIASFRTSKVISKLSPARIAEVEQQFKQLLGGVSDPFDTTQFQRVIGPESGSPLGEAVRGLLDEAGRAGYFPIAHQGRYRLALDGNFQGYFKTLDEAVEAAAGLEGRGTNAAITLSDFAIEPSAQAAVSGRELGRMVRAVKAASDVELTTTEAATLLREAGVVVGAGGPGRKFSRHLQPRKLGFRDLAEDPFRALKFYSYNMERTLAFNEVERGAQQIISNIPGHKTALTHWANTQNDLIMGRPTWLEEIVQNMAERWFPGEIEPRLLKRWSNFARRYQSNFRLGGIFSGIVNATQTIIGTAPMIGVKWTAEGVSAMLNKYERDRVMKFFASEGIDLGIHTGLGKDGRLIGSERLGESIKDALARKGIGENTKAMRSYLEAFENMWMFSFNQAERVNRFAAAWGAYRKGITPQASGGLGMQKDAALRYAQEIVEKTQFNYRASNIPQLMQGPVGGLLLQFKTFFINEIELLALVDNKTRLKILMGFQAVGGAGALLTIPGADLLDHASRLFFDTKFSEAIRMGAGKAREEDKTALGLTQFLAFGTPGLFPGGGLDMSRAVGLGGFMDITRGWLGPTFSDLNTLRRFTTDAFKDLDATGSVTADTWNNALRRWVPSQVRRGMTAYSVLKTGEHRDPYTGKLIYQPENRLRSARLAAVGTQETQLTIERAHDDFINRTVEGYRDARASYRKQIALAMISGDQTQAQELQAKAARAGITFTAEDLQRALQDFQRPAAERRARRTPVDLRDEMREFYLR